jgi:arylsulfatase A-like enzyme
VEQNRDRQFALWVSFQELHSPFDFPIEDAGGFDPRSFGVPKVGTGDGWQVPKIFEGLSDEEKRRTIAAYYTSAHLLDRNIGRVLGKLRQLGLDDNTVVVYAADHGYKAPADAPA